MKILKRILLGLLALILLIVAVGYIYLQTTKPTYSGKLTLDFDVPENGVTISPTGQSGNVMSVHYSDQAEMYATGKFRKMLTNREAIKSTSTSLLLKPAK